MFSFGNKKGHRRRDGKTAESRRPRLERRDALKNIDYEVSWTSASSDESPSLHASRSLDLSPASYSSQSSFRIGGSIEGEVEHLYRSLGLSGPEDFAIPIAAWEASLKVRSSSDVLSRSRWVESENVVGTSDPSVVLEEIRVGDDESCLVGGNSGGDGGIAGVCLPVLAETMAAVSDRSYETSRAVDVRTISTEGIREGIQDGVVEEIDVVREGIGIRDEEGEGISRPSTSRSGVKGTRPPVLIPPTPVSVLSPLPVRSVLPLPPSRAILVQDRASSTWEIVKSFAPDDEEEVLDVRRSLESDDEDDGSDGIGGGGEVPETAAMEGEMSDGAVSFSTSIDDDSSSTTTEIVISPNGRFKKKIRSWMRGGQLGSGSFGTVYEGISDDGTFIAVKEVSLLDKGKNAEQCILQLEQEIALLSQFEHENIVQYYGTDKEESKLYIFLELVTQGSIASLYQKYHLRDTQVSSYTRQILNGLNYLHERDVVHRDIKCANILVHANGSIKLADFGLAKEISKFNDLKSCKGSVYWMAPEVIHPKKTYGSPADIWSLGCTVLEMLTRQIPYPNVEWQHAFYRIGRGDQPPIPGNLSRDAQDFIRKCVSVDPSCRPTAAQLLEHPFVTRRPPLQTY